MNRYFGFNTLAGAFRSSSSVVEVTTAGRFDSVFVPNGISVPSDGTSYLQPQPLIGAASVTTLWTQFELYPNSTSASNTVVWEWPNSAGVVVVRATLASSGTVIQFQYWNGSAYVNIGTSAPISGGVRIRWTIKLTAGASGTVDVWSQGAPTGISATGMNAAVTNFVAPKLHAQFVVAGTGWVYSQIMGADEDLRDHRYYCEPLAALGTLTQGSGSVGDVNETVLDEATFAQLGTSGHKRSYTHPTFTLPGGYVIGAVVANSRVRVQGAGPTDAKLGLYDITAAASYLSGGLIANGGFEPRGYIWDQDPQAAAAWAPASYNDVEVIAAAA